MPHYYSEHQSGPASMKRISVTAAGKSAELYTGAGVFSKDHIDKGSELVIETAAVKDSQMVLDLGCGIGAVGIFIKLLHPGTEVLMSDINERAVFLSEKNIEHNRLGGISARKSDIFSEIPESFDTILLNPPQTAGREVCYRMIEESKTHLNQGGRLQLVARHNKGGSTLEKKMLAVFGNTRQAGGRAGFRVYVSEKR